MKKLLIILCLGVASQSITYAGIGDINCKQNKRTNKIHSFCPLTDRPGQVYHSRDLFNLKTPVAFFGIDYSHVRIRGNNMMDIKDKFNDLNKLFLTDKLNYDITKALGRFQQINYDFTAVNNKNSSIQDSAIYSSIAPNYTDIEIQKYIDELDLSSSKTKNGIGLVIMGQLLYNMGDVAQKAETESIYYFVFFDIVSKKLLFSEKIGIIEEKNPRRNLWGIALKNIIYDVTYYKYPYWKKAYGK